MHKHTRLLGFLGFLGFVIFASISSSTHAQITNDSGLTLSPPSFEINGSPGQPVSNVIRIENRNNFPVKIAVDRRNFTAVGEEGAVGLTEEETSFSLASWIFVDQEESVIPAKGSRNYTFQINVPLNAEPGGHFGSLVFRTIPSESLESTGATLAQEIGSLILVRVAGTTSEAAVIESFAPSAPLFEFGPVNLLTRVKNTGNVHLKPQGTISISNIFGQQIATVPLDSKNVLPGAIRRLESSWDTKWRLGYYTATLVMFYGQDNTQTAAITNFTIIPYRLVATILFILLLISFWLYRSRKRLKKAWKVLTSGKE